MLLRIERQPPFPEATLGAMLVDGRPLLFTREDPLRGDHVFVAGQTALPAGLYNLRFEWSRRFAMDLPLLVSTEPTVERRRGTNRLGMFIHPGEEWGPDLGGEILLGLTLDGTAVRQTVLAYQNLHTIIRAALDRGEAIEVEIN